MKEFLMIKKNILLLSIPMLLSTITISAQWNTIWDNPKEAVEDATDIAVQASLARAIHVGIQKTGKKIPYIGNQIAARMITTGLIASKRQYNYYQNNKLTPSNYLVDDQAATNDKTFVNTRNNKLIQHTVLNIALRIAASGVVEYFIDGTKYILNKCLQYVPSVNNQYNIFKQAHPTIASIVTTCAEETYRANINNTVGSGIDGVTHGNRDDFNLLQRFTNGVKDARFTVVFAYNS